MKILIVSDTHRKDENLKWVIRKTKPFDITKTQNHTQPGADARRHT